MEAIEEHAGVALVTLSEDGFKQFKIYIGADGKWAAKGRSSPAAEWTTSRGHDSAARALIGLREKVGTVTTG